MPWFDTFDAMVPQRFPGMEILKEEPMARHTTFQIGGPAALFAAPQEEQQLLAALDQALAEG